MKELHALVDFENVQPTLAELAERAPGFTDVWLFHGPHQDKQARQLAAAHARVTAVPRSGKGPNALDFHLSFYLGYVAAKHPHAQLVVIANDQGYDPMIEHAAQVLGFHVRRVGFISGKAPAAKKVVVAKPPKAAAVVQPAPARKAAAKAPVPAKKVAAKKAGTDQAAAQKAPAKKAPAKKAPAKKTPVKKSPVKKAAPPLPVKKVADKAVLAKKTAAQTPAPATKASQSASPAAPDAKMLERIKKGLARMGSKRPQKRKPFLRHLESMLGQASTPAALEALVKKLEQQNVVHVEGDRVRYS